jgi:excisionase family DNA binding protein
MLPDPQPDYLTVRECAEIMRVSAQTIYNLISRGEFPAERVGSDLRVWRQHFEEWRTRRLREFEAKQAKRAR